MKIQINGFDIELLENDSNISLKITDASGKELSNNTYAQSTIDTEVEPATINTPEEIVASQDDSQEDSSTTTAEESLIPTLEKLKK